MTQLRSPDEFMAAAKDMMLEGREPVTERDWMLVTNFVASNVIKGVEAATCLLFKMLYEVPLTEDQIREIAAFHYDLKE